MIVIPYNPDPCTPVPYFCCSSICLYEFGNLYLSINTANFFPMGLGFLKLRNRSFYTYPPWSVSWSFCRKNVKNSTKADIVRYFTSASGGNCNERWSGGIEGGGGVRTYPELYTAVAVLVFTGNSINTFFLPFWYLPTHWQTDRLTNKGRHIIRTLALLQIEFVGVENGLSGVCDKAKKTVLGDFWFGLLKVKSVLRSPHRAEQPFSYSL